MFTKPDDAFDPEFERLVADALAHSTFVTLRAVGDGKHSCLAFLTNRFGGYTEGRTMRFSKEHLAMRLAARGVKVKLEKQ